VEADLTDQPDEQTTMEKLKSALDAAEASIEQAKQIIEPSVPPEEAQPPSE